MAALFPVRRVTTFLRLSIRVSSPVICSDREAICDAFKELMQEAIEVVKNFDLLVDYQDAFLFVFNYVEQNAYVLNCIYDSGAGMLINVFQHPDLYTKDQLIEYFGCIVHKAIPEIIKSYK